MKSAKVPDADLLQRFDYNPGTGVFTWKIPPKYRSYFAGRPAGSKAYGYVVLQVAGHDYRAHRVAWFFTHGRWPTYEIDHINGVKDDNRIANLRDVPPRLNKQNIRRPNGKNVLGVKGVRAIGSNFTAIIRASGKTHYLGTHLTATAAYDAYVQAKRLLHEGCTL